MLIVTFYMLAVNPGIAFCNRIFKLTITISLGRQRTTTQPFPLVFGVVVAFHRRFFVLFHDHDIYLSTGGPTRTCTQTPTIMSRLLYCLSYRP